MLGAAGLLKGYKSACHWAWRDMLERLRRYLRRRARRARSQPHLGGGVTAGIDFGLTVAAELAGEEVAKSIQLVLEYDPQPPFDTGSPEKAGTERVKRIRERLAPCSKAGARPMPRRRRDSPEALPQSSATVNRTADTDRRHRAHRVPEGPFAEIARPQGRRPRRAQR